MSAHFLTEIVTQRDKRLAMMKSPLDGMGGVSTDGKVLSLAGPLQLRGLCHRYHLGKTARADPVGRLLTAICVSTPNGTVFVRSPGRSPATAPHWWLLTLFEHRVAAPGRSQTVGAANGNLKIAGSEA